MLYEDLNKLHFNLELIFVEDGSQDNSFRVLCALAKNWSGSKVIKLSRNFGSVNASKVGLAEGTGDVFTIMAADLQDPPSLIPQMILKWKKGYKFVICERSTREDPFFARLFSFVYYKILKFFVISDYPSGGFDMSLMDKQLIPYIVKSSKSAFTPLLAFWLGFRPAIIRYHRPARRFGKSQWTFGKKLSAMLDVFLGFSIKPIRFVMSMGILASIASFFYGVMVLISAFQNKTSVPGFASIMVFNSMLFGIVLSLLGLIGEVLIRILNEVNQRPTAVIESIEIIN